MTGVAQAAGSLGLASEEFAEAERRDREAFSKVEPKLVPMYRGVQRIVQAVNTMDGPDREGLVERMKSGDKEATYALAGYAHRVIAAVESFAAAFFPDERFPANERRAVEFVQRASDWLGAQGLESLGCPMSLALTRADVRHGAGLDLEQSEKAAAKQGGRR